MLLPMPFAQHIAVIVPQIVLHLTVHDAMLLPHHFVDILLLVPLVAHGAMHF